MRKILIILIILGIGFLWGEIAENLHHADTYYWLGIGENGDMASFAKGYEYLDKAEKEINISSLSRAERSLLKKYIETLRSDIAFQEDMAHDTFFGVFPLSRILGNSIFTDPGAYGTFEFVDDPDVIAVCNGASKVVETLNKSLKYSPQYSVIINSEPVNEALENEVRYIFNSDPRFFVHTKQEIIKALTPEEYKIFESNQENDGIIKKLGDSFNNSYIALITIKEIDIIDDIYFFIVEANTFNDIPQTSAYNLAEMSFCRDRQDALIPIWIINLLAFGLSILLFVIFSKIKIIEKGKYSYLILPVITFLWGRLLPWILNPILTSFQPEPETLVKLSFWWLIAYGVITICGSMLGWYLLSKRARRIVKILAPEGLTYLTLIGVGLGLSAYFGELIIIYQSNSYGLIVAQMLTLVSIGFILGHLLDSTRESAGWFIIPVILLSALFGLVVTRLIFSEMLILAGGAVIMMIIAFLCVRVKLKVSSGIPQPDFPDLKDDTELLDISVAITNPQYQKFSSYDLAKLRVSDFMRGGSGTILLTGPSGRGKTAMANSLLKDISSEIAENSLILKGECSEQETVLNPYGPLQQAMGHLCGINFNSLNKDNSEIDSLMDSLMDSVIPFSSLLLPGEDGESGVQSRDQLNALILSSLAKLARKKPIILYLDDIQWIDDASADFLKFLVGRLKKDSQLRILLLLTSRDTKIRDYIEITNEDCIELDPLSNENKLRILMDGLGFEDKLALQLLDSFGSLASKEGEMFFLLSTLSELAREDSFIKGKNGYLLNNKYNNVDELPIPDSYANSVMDQLKRVSDQRMIIECAACSGLEFEVDVLSKCLELPRLQLLIALNTIENETDLIYDVGEYDDIFAFRSSAVLEVLRSHLRIFNYGPDSPAVPQIVREYHARLAKVIELKNPDQIFEIAAHFYAAGRLFTDQAIEYCTKAAKMAAGLFQHNNARRYLDMAKECANLRGKVKDLEGDFLQIEIMQSLVENKSQLEVAKAAENYLNLNENVTPLLRMLISKAFYNAALASGDQNYFQKAGETAEFLAKSTTDEYIRAEAKHLVAISLPRDKKEAIVSNLKEAYKALMQLGENSLQNRELQSRIENSLAERFSYGNFEEKHQAEELFKHSIMLKEELLDKPGLARSWGGLGRLYLERDIIDKARKSFEKDLQICKEIGDKGGEIKMYSFIADCYSREGDFINAKANYLRSYQFADGLNDKLFAARGLVITGLKSGAINDLNEFGLFLSKNKNTAISIWSGFFDEINKLALHLQEKPDWLNQLLRTE